MINNGLTQYLLDFGYSDKDIQYIRSSYALKYFKQETLFSNIRSINDYFKNLGFCNDDIKKMIKSLPSIYGLSIENIKLKIKSLIDLGYNQKDVIKMLKSLPSIYGLSIENIKLKIKSLIDLGYSKDEVIKMTKIQPTLYNLNIENIKIKINDIMSLGYSKDEVIKIIKSLPSILGLNIKNIKEKLNFYNSITLSKFIINNPKYLMQSVELSYARYMFLTSSGLIIDETNYYRIFLSQKRFKASYNIDTDKLISMYDYNKIKGEKRK